MPFPGDEALRSAPTGSIPGAFPFSSKGKMLFKNIQEPVEVISITAEDPQP
jgi:hypothetical protein